MVTAQRVTLGAGLGVSELSGGLWAARDGGAWVWDFGRGVKRVVKRVNGGMGRGRQLRLMGKFALFYHAIASWELKGILFVRNDYTEGFDTSELP